MLFGELFLIVDVDAGEGLEEVDEENNLATVPLTVALTDPADVRVTAVEAPDAVQGGQPAVVHWTVTNEGVGPARSSADNAGWFDAVFLSPDGKLDRNDVLLGTREHSGDLAAGMSYSDTMRVAVPAFASGPYVFLVQTDRRDDVYEHLAEGNNLSTVATQLTLPAPSDLVVSAVTVPNTATPGDSTKVTWTVTNEGDNPALGLMREVVFVSADDIWDIDDPILGVIEREIDLAPGAQMEAAMQVDASRTYRLDKAGEVTEVLPGVALGMYHAIVRTDITNTIRETDDANNTGVSEGAMEVDVPELVPGVPETLTLAAGESRYYRLEAAADQDIRLTLTTDMPDAANELYASFETTGMPGEADVAAADPFTANQALVLPSTEAGSYYVQVLARSTTGEKETVTVLAEVLGFEVTGISPSVGGQGQVTTQIEGAGLNSVAAIQLTRGNAKVTEGRVIELPSTIQMTVRWKLDAVPVGTYDLTVVKSDGRATILAQGFKVQPAAPFKIDTRTLAPERIRAGGTANYLYEAENVGNVDVPYLLMGITADRTVRTVLRSNGFKWWTWSLSVLGLISPTISIPGTENRW